MTDDDRRRWNARWAEARSAEPPATWLRENLALLPAGRILDVAAGRGRNVPLLLSRARTVVAADVSATGLRLVGDPRALRVCMDLDAPGFRDGSFDGVVCVSFLDRRLFPAFARWLRPGGVLLFDSFRIDPRGMGHPRNPEHRLGHNELLRLLRDWRVLRYREGEVASADARSYRSSAVAIRPG